MDMNKLLMIYEICLGLYVFYVRFSSLHLFNYTLKVCPEFGRKRKFTFWFRYYFNPNLPEIPNELRPKYAKQRLLELIGIGLVIIYIPLFLIYRYHLFF